VRFSFVYRQYRSISCDGLLSGSIDFRSDSTGDYFLTVRSASFLSYSVAFRAYALKRGDSLGSVRVTLNSHPFSVDRKKRQVLVPGGCGYIGSHCVIELVNAGYEPIVVDNESNSCIGSFTSNSVAVER
jgi:hypothetical protein